MGLSTMKKLLFFLLIPAFVTFSILALYNWAPSLQIFNANMDTEKDAVETAIKIPAERVRLIEKQQLQLLGLGDSLTEGIGDPAGEGYIGIVKEKLESKYNVKVELKNAAKKGQRSDQLLKKVKKKGTMEEIAEADLIFLTIGGNDVMKVFQNHFFHLNVHLFEKQSEDFAGNLNEIIQMIRDKNSDAPIFMIGLFNPYFNYFSEIVEINEIIQIWNEKSLEILEQYANTYFIPIESLFLTENDELLHDDNFHPNRRGYEQIANQLLNELEKELVLNREN